MTTNSRVASAATGARGRVYRKPDLDVSTVGCPNAILHGGWAGEVHVRGRLVGVQVFGSQQDALGAVCAELQRMHRAPWRRASDRP